MRRTRTPTESRFIKKLGINSYDPHPQTQIILDRAMEHIQSVDYQVSGRWVFYRLLQEGHLKSKDSYGTFNSMISKARKHWHGDWRPWTLADETRNMDLAETSGEPPEPDVQELIDQGKVEAVNEIYELRAKLENYRFNSSYSIDPNYLQEYFIVIMFEARAMHNQFKKYTRGLTLCPFGGQPSIPYKWDIARFIREQVVKYRKPAVVLYFGDLDDAGIQIFKTGETDITSWAQVPVTFIRCGLTVEQVQRYKVPENYQKPDTYQWEALEDSQAREIIQTSLAKWYNFDVERVAKERAAEINSKVEDEVNRYLDENEIV